MALFALAAPGASISSTAFFLMMRVKRPLRNWDAERRERESCPDREPNSLMPVFTDETLWQGLPCPHVPSRRATAKAGAKSSGLSFAASLSSE
jgi:hypothetical protein